MVFCSQIVPKLVPDLFPGTKGRGFKSRPRNQLLVTKSHFQVAFFVVVAFGLVGVYMAGMGVVFLL